MSNEPERSTLERARARYEPRLPPLLERGLGAIALEPGEASAALDHREAIRERFPRTFGQPLLRFSEASGRGAAGPLRVGVVLSGGGGLMWVGTYGPMSTWQQAVERGCQLQDKYNITRSCYSRIMNEGHFAGLRWMLPYDQEDKEMVEIIKDL